MKYKKYPWPTDGATRKFVENHIDRLTHRLERAEASVDRLTKELKVLARWFSYWEITEREE